jgi:hypothetical protein
MGDGDIAEIVELTALEMALHFVANEDEDEFPVIKCQGLRITVDWPESSQ